MIFIKISLLCLLYCLSGKLVMMGFLDKKVKIEDLSIGVKLLISSLGLAMVVGVITFGVGVILY
jgi:hypothetical protein